MSCSQAAKHGKSGSGPSLRVVSWWSGTMCSSKSPSGCRKGARQDPSGPERTAASCSGSSSPPTSMTASVVMHGGPASVEGLGSRPAWCIGHPGEGGEPPPLPFQRWLRTSACLGSTREVLDGTLQHFSKGWLVDFFIEVNLANRSDPHHDHHGLGQCHIIELWRA